MQETICSSRNEEINYKFWGLKRSFLPLDGRSRRPTTTTTTAAVTITKLNFLADRIPWKYKQRNRIYLNWNCNIQPFARECERGMKKCVAQSLDKVSFSYFLAGRINFFNNLPSKVFGCKSSPANTWEENEKENVWKSLLNSSKNGVVMEIVRFNLILLAPHFAQWKLHRHSHLRVERENEL